jgi:hypothetical protein
MCQIYKKTFNHFFIYLIPAINFDGDYMKITGSVLQFTQFDDTDDIKNGMRYVTRGGISRIDVWSKHTSNATTLQVAKIKDYDEDKFVVCCAGSAKILLSDRIHVRYIDSAYITEYISAISKFRSYINIPTRLAPLIEYVPTTGKTDPRLIGDSMSTPIGWGDDTPDQLSSTVDLIHAGKLESIDVGGSTYRIANVSPFRRVDVVGNVGYGNEGMNLIVLAELPDGMCVCIDEENTLSFIKNEKTGMHGRIHFLYSYVTTKTLVHYDRVDMVDDWIGRIVTVKDTGTRLMIIGLTDCEVIIGMDNYPLDVAFNLFTWNDGKPFGKSV